MKNVTIYSASHQLLTVSSLRKLSDITRIESDGGILKKPTWFKVICGDLEFRLNIMASSEIAEHLKGLEGYARTCHESDTIPNLEEVFAYIKCLRQAYGLITENDFGFDSKLWVILKKIADSVDGVLFVCDSLVDTKDLVIFGPLGSDE